MSALFSLNSSFVDALTSMFKYAFIEGTRRDPEKSVSYAGSRGETPDPTPKQGFQQSEAQQIHIVGRELIDPPPLAMAHFLFSRIDQSPYPFDMVTHIEDRLRAAGKGYEALDINYEKTAGEMRAEVIERAITSCFNMAVQHMTEPHITNQQSPSLSYIERLLPMGYIVVDKQGAETAAELHAGYKAKLEANEEYKKLRWTHEPTTPGTKRCVPKSVMQVP